MSPTPYVQQALLKFVGIALNKVNDMVSPEGVWPNEFQTTDLQLSSFVELSWVGDEGGWCHIMTKQVIVLCSIRGATHIFKMRLVTVNGKNERSAPSTFTQASVVRLQCIFFFLLTTTQIQGRSRRHSRLRRCHWAPSSLMSIRSQSPAKAL